MAAGTEFLVNALIAGILLGGFYAAVTIGISISFGLLDIANIAHPAFVIVGSYWAYILNQRLGIDPLVAGMLGAPLFYLLGAALYDVYHRSFERRGKDMLRGLAFFFGLMFIVEVGLIMLFGIDFRYVQADYVNRTLRFGGLDLPLRLFLPFVVSILLVTALQIYLNRTYYGRAIKAVAQDQTALSFLAANPMRIKKVAFALSIATASIAGALLIIIQPIEPSVGREYVGRVFAICVLGGMGSLPGAVLGALMLGVIESLTSSYLAPSWAPAIAFGFLLVTLAVRPAGLMGR